jgi:HEPN domain-containing protein
MNDPSLIMWSAMEIAARDSVSKQAVSKQIKALLEAKPETPVERDGRGRVIKVSLAHHDEFRQRYVNPLKASAPLRPLDADGPQTPSPPAGDSLEEARRQSEWLKVGREKIRHQEELGQLVRKDTLAESVRISGTEIKTVIARLQNRADDIALAVSREGVHGVRVLLRRISFELGNEVADKLGEIVEIAPDVDALIEDSEG